MRDGALVVDDVETPPLQAGQIRARVKACGICGSDLHTLHHADRMVEMSRSSARGEPIAPVFMDPNSDVVMGHEFSAEVLEVGPNVGNAAVGDLVVSMPIVFDMSGVHPIGYSNLYPGGYAEEVVLADVLSLKVPNGLTAEHAALTEPMAVGLHAVNKARVTQRDAAVVIGCGPVGLAVIAALAAAGCETIVAADYSTRRRALAAALGATEVVDPREEPPVDAWRRVDGRRQLVVFEAVGIPGMLAEAITAAPRNARICVVGVCMEPDRIDPMIAIGKELSVQFVLGYDPAEFGETLRRIAEGELDVAPLITGHVGLDGVAGAFEALADPDAHAKILVVP